jgi:hypothetical protein
MAEESNPENVANQRAQELVQAAEREAGSQAIKIIVDQHLETITSLRSQFPLDNIELLSGNISQKSSVVGEVSNDLAKLHDKIRVVISNVAETIENERYQSAEEAIEGMSLGFNENQRAAALVAADKAQIISCHSLNIAVDIFATLNNLIKQQIEEAGQEKDPVEERNLLLGNAILVYELTDFVINYIENFKIAGVSEILEIHAEAKVKNQKIYDELDQLKKMAEDPGISLATRESTLLDIQNRKNAISIIEGEWEKYVQQCSKVSEDINGVSGNLPTLRLIKANAQSQLNVLEAVAVLQIVNSNIGALRETLKAIESVDLVSLSPERVRRLLGLSETNSTSTLS